MTVVSNCAEDSAASFDICPASDSGTVHTQPMCVAKLHRHTVVHASNSLDPNPASDPDPVVLDSSCSSSSYASDSSSRTNTNTNTNTNNDASTSVVTPTTSISSESPIPVEPLSKTFHRRGIPSKPTVKVECIDVDDTSSSAPLATLLRESDHFPTDYANR